MIAANYFDAASERLHSVELGPVGQRQCRHSVRAPARSALSAAPALFGDVSAVAARLAAHGGGLRDYAVGHTERGERARPIRAAR